MILPSQDTRMEVLILNASQLFEDPPSSSSPPLPAVPVGEMASTYQYGSSHTRIASVPPRPQSPKREQDFHPLLPPRPTNSIHPSLRANPVSPIGASMYIPPLPRPQAADDERCPSPSSDSRTDYQIVSRPSSPLLHSPQTGSISLSRTESLRTS